jgi:hypothetical protein
MTMMVSFTPGLLRRHLPGTECIPISSALFSNAHHDHDHDVACSLNMVAVNTVVSSSFVIIGAFDPALFTQPSATCLAENFYGQYGTQALFLPPLTLEGHDCLGTAFDHLTGVDATALDRYDSHTLVWVEEDAVEEDVRADTPAFIEALRVFILDNNLENKNLFRGDIDGSQTVLTPRDLKRFIGYPNFDLEYNESILFHWPTAALLNLPLSIAEALTRFPPRLWSVRPVTQQSYTPVPKKDVARIRDLGHNTTYDPIVAALVDGLSVPHMQTDIAYLTGESSESSIVSRHSFAEGSRTAANWLKTTFEGFGATCELRPFLLGFAPNVICSYPGTRPANNTALVVLSAHYDSRGSFGSLRAPGGDDDGSGTTALLALARQIYKNGITFNHTVVLAAFAGEEQGLLGSKAYARELRSNDVDVLVQIQADMLAYRREGEPAQLGLPDLIGTPEVAALVSKLAALYAPELSVGYTPACCSDHQSFHEQGYAATQVFERAGPIADPSEWFLSLRL